MKKILLISLFLSITVLGADREMMRDKAIIEGDMKQTLDILNSDEDVINFPGVLYLAAASQSAEMVELLIMRGADCDERNGIDGKTPLIVATGFGSLDIVNLLLRQKALPNLQNKKGNTALFVATRAGRSDIVESLLRHKASVHIPNQDGVTPLTVPIFTRSQDEEDKITAMREQAAKEEQGDAKQQQNADK